MAFPQFTSSYPIQPGCFPPALCNNSSPLTVPHYQEVPFSPEECMSLDTELERFYRLCLFQKPSSKSKTGQSPPLQGLNTVELGNEFFGQVVVKHGTSGLVAWFLRLLFRLPFYLDSQAMMGRNIQFIKEGLGFRPFLIKTFLLYLKGLRSAYFRRIQETKVVEKNGESESAIQPSNNADEFDVQLSTDEQEIFLNVLVRVDFPPVCKIHTLISAANISPIHKDDNFAQYVITAIAQGQVSFWALTYALKRFPEDFKDVAILAVVVLLGTVNGKLVEDFTSDRDEKSKERARQVLLLAETWTESEHLFSEAVRHFAHRHHSTVPPFNEFVDGMVDLMAELRREMPRCNIINPSWAFAAVKRSLVRYCAEEWSTEQVNDVLASVIIQRPEMRRHVISQFSRKGKDEVANYWKRKNNTFFDKGATINLHEEREQYLTIPIGVDVFIVDKPAKLQFVAKQIQDSIQNDCPIVGLDAEWSPYAAYSCATILQMAFKNVVFIVDLDAMTSSSEHSDHFISFLDAFFSDPNITKIGFHFHEDLLQLRKRLPSCNGLYKPENLICISKIISELISKSRSVEHFDLSEFIQLNVESLKEEKEENGVEEEESPKLLDEDVGPSVEGVDEVAINNDSLIDESNTSLTQEKEKELVDESMESISQTLDESVELATEPPKAKKKKKKNKKIEEKEQCPIKNMGLSNLCGNVFGKQLDKSEQCSVWNRRPLRPSQIRYAALDAYCILMLYDHCGKWATKLGVSVEEIAANQEPIYAPLPLFYDTQCLKQT